MCPAGCVLTATSAVDGDDDDDADVVVCG